MKKTQKIKRILNKFFNFPFGVPMIFLKEMFDACTQYT